MIKKSKLAKMSPPTSAITSPATTVDICKCTGSVTSVFLSAVSVAIPRGRPTSASTSAPAPASISIAPIFMTCRERIMMIKVVIVAIMKVTMAMKQKIGNNQCDGKG